MLSAECLASLSHTCSVRLRYGPARRWPTPRLQYEIQWGFLARRSSGWPLPVGLRVWAVAVHPLQWYGSGLVGGLAGAHPPHPPEATVYVSLSLPLRV